LPLLERNPGRGNHGVDTLLSRSQILHPKEFSYIIKILHNKDNIKKFLIPNSTNIDMKKRALNAVRDYGVQLALFRNAMDEWAGLNATDMECLRILFLEGVSAPSKLSRHTGLSSGATTAMLDRLEKAGLIERQPNPADRRGTLIVPAKSSAEKIASWFESARKAQAELVGKFSEKELEVIAVVFEQFAKLWEQEREKIRKVI
jgi:DNA-binding MarR family transcriptional regulator